MYTILNIKNKLKITKYVNYKYEYKNNLTKSRSYIKKEQYYIYHFLFFLYIFYKIYADIANMNGHYYYTSYYLLISLNTILLVVL